MATNIYEQIHRDLDIVEVIGEYVPLAKKGRSFVGLCPFHADKDPSLSISPTKQVYNCFSCGQKGDVIKFVADFEKISRDKAVTKLAARLGITYQSTQSAPLYTPAERALLDVMLEAMTYFAYNIDIAEGAQAKAYAISRGLDAPLRSQFLIGYAPAGQGLKKLLTTKNYDEANMINASLINARGESFFANRLIFGITNQHGDVVAFSARSLTNDGPKYLNSSDSLVFHKNAVLYNFSQARDAIEQAKALIICEGQMDVIALHRSGFKNVIALMGTALTPEHFKLLSTSWHVTLNFDADKAGQNATFKAINALLTNQYQVSVLVNDQAKDVDAILAASGAPGVAALVANKQSALTWSLNFLVSALVEPLTATSLETLFKQLGPIFWRASNIEQALALNALNKKIALSTEAITEALKAYQPARPVLAAVPRELPPLSAPFEYEEAPVTIMQPPRLRYTHMLLKSMLLVPSLIQYYRAHAKTVLIAETQLASLARYLAMNVQVDEAISVPLELAEIAAQVQAERIQSIKTEAEFQDLIDLVNIEFYNYFIDVYLEKLKGRVSIDEISQINQIISEFKAKKEEIYAKK